MLIELVAGVLVLTLGAYALNAYRVTGQSRVLNGYRNVAYNK